MRDRFQSRLQRYCNIFPKNDDKDSHIEPFSGSVYGQSKRTKFVIFLSAKRKKVCKMYNYVDHFVCNCISSSTLIVSELDYTIVSGGNFLKTLGTGPTLCSRCYFCAVADITILMVYHYFQTVTNIIFEFLSVASILVAVLKMRKFFLNVYVTYYNRTEPFVPNFNSLRLINAEKQ